ncbi:unnamed protein product [Periconia digitata]|uniref:Uncharacterized protein n=1 Tax=Periconia digitata TaxID=1303443 RepID=A0A9W4UEW6_9PLEO|nr:unnamed protein product [Periconia digitata]
MHISLGRISLEAPHYTVKFCRSEPKTARIFDTHSVFSYIGEWTLDSKFHLGYVLRIIYKACSYHYVKCSHRDRLAEMICGSEFIR